MVINFKFPSFIVLHMFILLGFSSIRVSWLSKTSQTKTYNLKCLKFLLLFPEKFVETSASSVTSTPEPPILGTDCQGDSVETASGGRDSPVDVSSTSSEGVQGQSSGRRSPSATTPKNPLLQERWSCEELRNVTCHLETKDLWDKFNELGTEMIITKTGRYNLFWSTLP